jgi:CubicO group peptidase (beta-lactamase class C family)
VASPLTLAGCPVRRPAPEAIDKAELTAGLDAYLGSIGKIWGEAYRLSGFVMVTQHGEPVYARGFGHADREKGIPNGPDTTFRIGSLTKQFTAVAILQLQEQGKLSVEDTVRKHLPDYPETGDKITIHQLLTHTAGIPEYTAGPDFWETTAKKEHSVEQLLDLFKDKPLQFEPGEEYRYSNSGYVLLGAIIEAVSGQTYAEYVREHVFTPAGMHRTGYGDAVVQDDVARGYEIDENEAIVLADPGHVSVPHAAGGIRSTANDLVQWDRVLSGDKILSKASRDAMYTPEKAGYAYGWRVGDHDGRRWIGHGGGINGFGTWYTRVPDEGIVVVAWLNKQAFRNRQVGRAATLLALGEKPPPHEEPAVHPVDPAQLDRIVGGYVLSEAGYEKLHGVGLPEEHIEEHEAVTMIHRDGRVYLHEVGQPELELFGAKDGSSFAKRLPVIVTFEGTEGDETGKMEKMIIDQGVLELVYLRDDEKAAQIVEAWKEKKAEEEQAKKKQAETKDKPDNG